MDSGRKAGFSAANITPGTFPSTPAPPSSPLRSALTQEFQSRERAELKIRSSISPGAPGGVPAGQRPRSFPSGVKGPRHLKPFAQAARPDVGGGCFGESFEMIPLKENV